MNDNLNIDTQVSLIASLTNKLNNPSFYNKTVIEEKKLEITQLKNEYLVINKQRSELQIEIQNLLTREPYLVNENQELAKQIKSWQIELDQAMIDLLNHPEKLDGDNLNRFQREKSHHIQELKNNINHAELRMAEISTQLNLRKIKEERLLMLDVKVAKNTKQQQSLNDDLEIAKNQLDLVNDPVGRDLYLSDYERLYGIKQANELRLEIEDAIRHEQPMIVTDSGLVRVDVEENNNEVIEQSLESSEIEFEEIPIATTEKNSTVSMLETPNPQLPLEGPINQEPSLLPNIENAPMEMDIKDAPAGLSASIWQSLKNKSRTTKIILLMAALMLPSSLVAMGVVGMVGASLIAKNNNNQDEGRSR